MVVIQLLRNLSLSSARLALPKGFNRPSALGMFMQKEFKNVSAGVDGPPKVVLAAVAKKWNLLSAPEKEQYEKDAVKLGEERRQLFTNLVVNFAFALFVKEQSFGKGRKALKAMAECAKTWSAMKAEDKAKYEEEAEKRKEEYSAAKAQIQKK